MSSKNPSVQQAVRWWTRRGYLRFMEEEDLFQQAELVAAETTSDEPEKVLNPAYLFTALRRQLGTYISRTVSVVSIKGNWKAGMENRYRWPLHTQANSGAAPSSQELKDDRLQKLQARLATGATPEEALATAQVHRLREQLGQSFHAELQRLLEDMEPRDLEVVRLKFGLGGGEPLKSDAIARLLGVSNKEVYRSWERVLRRLRSSLKIYQLHHQLTELANDER